MRKETRERRRGESMKRRGKDTEGSEKETVERHGEVGGRKKSFFLVCLFSRIVADVRRVNRKKEERETNSREGR